MACRTTAALTSALLILFLLTKAARQPLTVALLGVVITMVAARSVNEPDPHRQKITMALLPVPAALAITAATLLAPHVMAADVMFVLVVFSAVYVRRFGPRGTALGMVTFMAYFFSLYLRAKTVELPWMIGAVLVGAVCSFGWNAYLMPDRPESVLRRTIQSLRARMTIVVDTTAEAGQAGQLDERSRRRLRIRVGRLNQTALMVQSQSARIAHVAGRAEVGAGGPDASAPSPASETEAQVRTVLRPTTRQAIQVAVAASLANRYPRPVGIGQ